MAAAKPSGSFKFKKNSNIGAAAAEDDIHYLDKCYVSTGDLEVLTDSNNPKRIVIGRTGSGKTALLTKLRETQRNVIEISPFNLAVEHISNSQIFKVYTDAGVNLDPFFKLLWRHIFTVELIKKVHGITDWKSQSVFFTLSQKSWSDQKKKQYQFLLDHGDSFWKETDERVKETTTKTETELKGGLKNIVGLDLGLEASKKWSEEQKAEIRSVGQEVVSRAKLKDLNQMFELLKSELDDEAGYAHFIVIDDLDQGWADDTIRYKLIHALIETIREFKRVENVKIVICLRTDLIERVIRQIKGPGYQEEKLKSLFLNLTWTVPQLTELLDTRINQLVHDSFTLATITHKDLLPNIGKRGSGGALKYILDRTLMRPRDLISFFNACIEKAVDRPNITKTILQQAEGDYSLDRRRSLEQEWQTDYPDLNEFIDLFKKQQSKFRIGDITEDKLLEFIIKYTAHRQQPEGALGYLAYQFYNDVIGASVFRITLASILYSIGFLGIKTETYTSMQFVGLNKGNLSKDDINDSSQCSVHKMYWRALGIHDRETE